MINFSVMNETNRVPVLNNTPVCALPHRLVAVGDLEADTKQEHKARAQSKHTEQIIAVVSKRSLSHHYQNHSLQGSG